jgi:hypothetical protein
MNGALGWIIHVENATFGIKTISLFNTTQLSCTILGERVLPIPRVFEIIPLAFIHPLTITWIQQNLDSVVSRYLQKWLIPVCCNISHFKSKLGVL